MGKIKKETITGFVINKPDSLSAFPYNFMLLGDDGEDYYLNSKKGELDLDSYFDTKMSFTGSTSTLHRGFKLLTVSDFESLEVLKTLEENDEDNNEFFDDELELLDLVV